MKSIFLIAVSLLITSSAPPPSFKRFACAVRGNATEGSLASTYRIYSSSGNLQIDQATIRELLILQQSFLVYPVFFFYDDDDGKNAQATPEVLNPTNGPDGTVIFGKRMFNREYVRSYGGTTIPIIIAHEYAHIVDVKYGVLENASSKKRELFADVFAGMYICVRGSQGLYTDLSAVQACFNSLGDTDFGSEDHHGTPEERAQAVFYGYNFILGRARQGLASPLNVAIDEAKRYVDQFDDEE